MTTMAAGKQLNHILVFKGMPEGHIANKILPYIHVDVFMMSEICVDG